MHSRAGMDVSVRREIVVAVPQPGLNVFQRVAKIQHNRGIAMAKLVEAEKGI